MDCIKLADLSSLVCTTFYVLKCKKTIQKKILIAYNRVLEDKSSLRDQIFRGTSSVTISFR